MFLSGMADVHGRVCLLLQFSLVVMGSWYSPLSLVVMGSWYLFHWLSWEAGTHLFHWFHGKLVLTSFIGFMGSWYSPLSLVVMGSWYSPPVLLFVALQDPVNDVFCTFGLESINS